MKTRGPDLPIRFWAKVRKSTEPNGCWLWTGAKLKSGGYGAIRVGGRNGITNRAHCLSWTWACGDIPPGMFICHHCDTPACVRPNHLFLGTAADNSHDMVRKGRYVQPTNCGHAGIEHYAAKLSEQDVLAIRKRYAAGRETYASLAAAYRVTFSNIAAIVKRRSWRHLS